jgi:membrane-associated phospholipid phosphatase
MRGRVCAALWLALMCAPATVRAQAPGPAAGDGRRTVAQLPANLLRGAVGVFSRENLAPAIVGAAAGGAAATVDGHVADALADPESGFGSSLEAGGDPMWSGVAVAGLFAVGRLSEPGRFRAATYDWFEAFLLTGAYTSVLKAAVGRERPNGQDHRSFPSGHSSNAFALAAVAQRHYGWKVGIPAYVTASAVAVSRLRYDKHYLSDVVAGAALGLIVGQTVVRVNDRAEAVRAQPRLSVSPVVARRTRAVIVGVAFN